MKPLYLEMNYFGPHEHSAIDFDKLDESPIFLISGDTGAGKSTIFDAMTFALFGSTTSDRKPSEMRSQFASPEQKTSVVFYFEQGNFIYKVERCPDQEVKKKRGEGTKLEKTSAHLSVVEAIHGIEIKNLASKPSDVDVELLQLLNITADQFKKIILLPQNDFSKFLKSKTDEKEAILKKIFGTVLFTKFSTAIKDQFDQVSEQNKSFSEQLKIQYNAQVWSTDEREELENTLDTQKLDKLVEFQKNRENKEKKQQENVSELKKIKTDADAVYESGIHLNQKFKDKAQLEQTYKETILEQAPKFEENQRHIKQLKWAQSFRDLITQIEKEQKIEQENRENEEKYQKEVKNGKEQLQNALTELEQLQNRKDEISQKRKEVEEITVQIPQAQEAEEIEAKLKALKEKQKQSKQAFDKLQEEKEKLSSEFSKKKEQLSDGEKLSVLKNQLKEMQLHFSKTLLPLAIDLDRLTKESKKLEKKHKESVEQTQDLYAVYLEKKATYEVKIKERRALMIAQLQNELVDGEPCQVCGAKEHHLSQHIEVSDAELKRAMDEVDQSQKDYAACENAYHQSKENEAKSNKELEEKLEELKGKNESLNQLYAEFCSENPLSLSLEFDKVQIENQINEQLEKVSEKENANQIIQKQIEQLEKNVLENDSALQELSVQNKLLIQKINGYNESIKNKKEIGSSKTLKALKKDLTTVIQSFDESLLSAQEKKNTLEKTLAGFEAKLEEVTNRLKMNRQEIAELQKSIDIKLEGKGALSQDLDEIKHWLKEDLEKLSNQIQVYTQQKLSLEAELKKITQEINEVEKPDVSMLEARKTEAAENHLQAEKELVVSKTELTQVSQVIDEIIRIHRKQGDLALETEEITKLWNAINGKSEDKLKLETYVVQSYLEKILEYANDHFINVLSNNRYQFELSEQVVGRGSQGLEISIYDNETGASRSSNTLSGGETFIAALSIALSLSEVVQNSANGVQIEALFIDEGFGSLDHETLQKAMTALEQIGENRMVGVISHVEEMKKTIGQQILINKIGDGRSRVEMVNR